MVMPEHKKKEKKHPKVAKPHRERAPKPKVVKEAGGRMLEPDTAHKAKPLAKKEALDFLNEMAPGFDKVRGMLDLPDGLYMRNYDFSTAYSARADADSLSIESALRIYGSELPDAKQAVFTIGFVSDASDPKTSFFLCDPKRRIIVSEYFLYMGKGSWDEVADTLGRVLDKKKELDGKKEKYNFVVGFEGSVSVR